MNVWKWCAFGIVVFGFPNAYAFAAEKNWFPIPVEVGGPAFKANSPKTVTDYMPLKAGMRPWDICVSFPHIKDSYWLSVNYGVVDEAKRLGVGIHLFHAGGYDNLALQIEQIQECVQDGGKGVVIGAVSFDGLNPLIAELKDIGIPVVDLVNGMSSPFIKAKSLVSFTKMGASAGNYIAKRHAFNNKGGKVAWFPGPKGAGWVKKGDRGFRQALSASTLKIAVTRYGETDFKTQTRLLEEVLNNNTDFDYIVGTAVTAEAAVTVLRKRGLSDKIKVVAYYFTPGVQRGIKRGTILAAPTDSAVIQGRIAIDQMVRILDKKPFLAHVSPEIYIIDKSNISTFDRYTSIAPGGFWPNFIVNRVFQ
ncbi:MAG: TMAO reductase system periplasmic protein TorT [Candidatus Hydrogenedentota bacterium]|nr:TMAO reductase system periplasmic protein TorT [Magnetovibrio sp.]PCJ63838.1 MAG: TMAO reductase system periplasmic protein TorT [Candidatus Hydrogenedentota bacterium]